MRILRANAGFLSKSEVARILSTHKRRGSSDEETIKHLVLEYCKGTCNADAAEAPLRKAGLFEFEIYQLLDACPQSLLTLQLIIDEMEERYSQKELDSILEMFRPQDTC